MFFAARAPRIKTAGPVLDGEGGMAGFLLIVEARGGLFESVDLSAWRWTLGAPA